MRLHRSIYHVILLFALFPFFNLRAQCAGGEAQEVIKLGQEDIYFHNAMVFKLKDDAYDETMVLDGASIFEPSKGRPMKGWIQLLFDYVDQRDNFAKAASDYVSALPANKKKLLVLI